LYYLGYHAWAAQDYEKAHKIWSRLLREFGDSPWAASARVYLEQKS
jgi:TolA-binding protein